MIPNHQGKSRQTGLHQNENFLCVTGHYWERGKGNSIKNEQRLQIDLFQKRKNKWPINICNDALASLTISCLKVSSEPWDTFTLMRLAIIKNTVSSGSWPQCIGSGTTVYCCQKCKMVPLHGKLAVPKNVKHKVTSWPPIQLMSVNPRELKTQVHTKTCHEYS